jgi:hypothetical protein
MQAPNGKGTIDGMSTPLRSPLTSLLNRLLPRLRYPYLFLILAALFLIDLVVPDPIPMVDEILLAVLTFIAATFRARKDSDLEPRDITPPDDAPGSLSSGQDPSPTDDA